MTVTHKKSKTGQYHVWTSMRQRCYDRKCHNYADYGGRGITVCERWKGSYEAFLTDVGERPSGGTLERINNDGNYEPGNMRWATKKEQANNRRSSRLITWDGETMTLSQWADFFAMPLERLFRRLSRGWSFEDAVSLPARTYKGDTLTYRGTRLSINAWAKMCGVPRSLFHNRKYQGWATEQILCTPIQRHAIVK